MSGSTPTFLTLPTEIRLHIYTYLYPSRYSLPPPSDHSGITSVCSQIRQETFPFVLRVPRYFGNAQRLRRWTSRGDRKHLDRISDISAGFYVDSISEFCVLKNAPIDIDDDLAKHSGEWWEARYLQAVRPEYFKPPSKFRTFLKTVKKITKFLRSVFIKRNEETRRSAVVSTWETFNCLPGLRKLGIAFQVPPRFAPDGSSPQYPNMVNYVAEHQLILEMISVACPVLQSLIIANASERLNLSCLTSFHNLRHLGFNGEFGNSPEEAISVLKSLRYLDSLSLMWLNPNWSGKTYFTITLDMIGKLNPLRSLSLSLMNQTASGFLSAPMLEGLANHRDSLRILSIDFFCCVDGDFVAQLLAFISTSYITDLMLMLRVTKDFAALDLQSYFPATIEQRYTSFLAAKRRDTESFPWTSDVMILCMQGTSR